jgi:hypothetical protein
MLAELHLYKPKRALLFLSGYILRQSSLPATFHEIVPFLNVIFKEEGRNMH